VEPTKHQICIQARSTERLEGMTLHGGAVNTVFAGKTEDQAVLYGLLDRLRDLGQERAAGDRSR
jgi:hypothetical protein